jgi:uncharacterized protein
MRWQDRRRSGNVIDRRGRSGAGGGAGLANIGALLLGGLLRGRRRGGRGLQPGRRGPGRGGCGGAVGCGTIILLILVVLFVLGVNPLALLESAVAPGPAEPRGSAPGDEAGEFVAVVLAETEDTWHALFEQAGRRYSEPELVLFSNTVRSACGMSGQATGPFYCPADDRIYLDLAFFRQLERLGATGEFAVAYVIAHEVGHHVQRQLGVLDTVRSRQQRLSPADANALQVRVELQADCYAGVWAHFADRDGLLRPGDLQNGIDAAAAVGSDHLARQSGRPVQPETFTHGTSAERVEWFRRGFDAGSPEVCDTLD